MNRTRLSLVYPAAYLTCGGLGLMIAPQTALELLLSSGTYEDVLIRLLGIMLFSLGVVVAQIVRLEIRMLYLTTLVIRLLILVGMIALFFVYGDPMLVVLSGIVGLGFLITAACYVSDRGRD